MFAQKTVEGRFFGVDVGDWSMFLFGIALFGMIMVFV
jgi:hypothetical protein